MDLKRIGIFGAGYVGNSLGILLSHHFTVTIFDINKEKIERINKKMLAYEIEEDQTIDAKYFSGELDARIFSRNINKYDLYIVAVPTDYDPDSNFFDTSNVEDVIETIDLCDSEGIIIIKSTVPVGYTKTLQERYPNNKIIFSPEFLREGSAIHDNEYPSRIIVGDKSKNGEVCASVFSKIALNDPEVLFMDVTEAEAVKLFSNTYLAMRISFFNELDTYCSIKEISAVDVINGVCKDQRIGNYYNNPSFGYGGYCLPKDSKQLLANYVDVPQNIIQAVVESNETRKQFIVDEICKTNFTNIGIYKLGMKKGSLNLRSSAIIDIMQGISDAGKRLIIYEPNLLQDDLKLEAEIINDLGTFFEKSDLIIANRRDKDLDEHNANTVFTRDIFNEN